MNEFINLRLSNDADLKLRQHLRGRIKSLEDSLHQLHEDKITKWRKAYEATPREQTRDFPFYNASNMVVPIIGIFTDTLQARVMSALLKTRPPWVAKVFGNHPDLGDDCRVSLEEFTEYVGIEPAELDLYRVYHEWTGDTIKYGTSVVKCPHEVRFRDDLIETAGDGEGKQEAPKFIRETEYSGPRPEKIAFENFYIPPNAKTLETADIIVHKRTMVRSELEERRFFQVYDPIKVDEILKKPDRTGPSYTDSMKQQSAGVQVVPSEGYGEWDLFECWLKWPTPDGKFRPRIIATYHKQSDTLLRAIYDTHKLFPFVLGRLFYRDDSIYGYGFCETLWSFQEETSEQHNGRLDNRTISNTRIWRVSPDSKLHSGYRIYPSAMVPAEKDEIEPLASGDVSEQTIDDERFSLELAERRAGVSPPMQGMGAGQQGKRGVYTAMGTLSLLQEGNRRTDLNISDMRYSHTRLGRVILSDYANYGVRDGLLELFGEKGKIIQKALDAVKSGRIGLPIYSSTSSVNKEVEKQSDLMLSQVMRQHYGATAQVIVQLNSPMTPAPVKDYLGKALKSMNMIMRAVLRSFDKEDVDVLVPDYEAQNVTPNGQAPGQAQPNAGVVRFPGGQNVPPVPGGAVPAGVGGPGQVIQ
jgi:hypothetical protein